MKFKILPMLLALSVLPASTVWADDEYETGQVVISASRMEQMIEDVSTNIDVITAEEIQKMGVTNVTDLLNMQVGYHTGQRSNPTVRGMSVNYTLFLIDGRKVALSENKRDGFANIFNSININNIERIEIIKGAASAMYGSDAMAGVINIITKKGMEASGAISTSLSQNELVTNYTYDFGRIDNWTAKMDASFTKGTGFKYRSSTLQTATGEYKESAEGNYTTNGVGTKLNIGGALGYIFNENHDVLASYSYNTSDPISRAYSLTDGGGHGGVDEVRTDTLATSYLWHNASIDYRGNLGGHQYSLTPSMSYSQWVPATSASKNYWYRDLNLDAMDIFALNDWNLFSLGASYKISDLYHSSAITQSRPDGRADTMHKIGAFVQDEILLFNESLILLPSVRFDYSNFGDPQVTARLGATYEFLPNQRFKFNVGQAYYTPDLNYLAGAETTGGDVYTMVAGKVTIGGVEFEKDADGNALQADDKSNAGDTSISGVSMGVADLKPETAITVDARYEGNFGALNTSLGGYYTVKQNAISTTDVYEIINEGTAAEPVYRAVRDRKNIDGTSYYMGVEAEASYDIGQYFNIFANYLFMHNMDEDGYRLGEVTTHTIGYGLNANYPNWDIFASIWGKAHIDYQQSADTETTDNSVTSQNFFDLNLSLGKTFKEKYTLVGSVDNIIQSKRAYERGDGVYAASTFWSRPVYKVTFTTTF